MSTDAITVALCTSGHRATKRIRAAADQLATLDSIVAQANRELDALGYTDPRGLFLEDAAP